MDYLIVKEYFDCPNPECGMQYHEGEELRVQLSPTGISAVYRCESCETDIELIVNDDNTVEI